MATGEITDQVGAVDRAGRTPNLRPGPTEQGGHGGMATREQEARIYEEQKDTEPSD